jgi:hypothetical protein
MRKFLLLPATLLAAYAFADLDGSYILPRDHAAIHYDSAPVHDRIAALSQKLRDGKVQPEFGERHGYLEPILKALDVPVSSQMLVFSKTSFQAPRISPRMARALYFTDDVYVGWVPGGDVLELAAFDPTQGVVFYTMDQESGPKPRIDRRDECLQCHASGGTLGVPGVVVRSVFVERSGMPLFQAGGFVTDHRSPLSQRWGGWYVTGTHGPALHMGNVFAEDRDHPDQLDREKGANVIDLKGRIDIGNYLTNSSDIVALMTLEHQTRMTNLITRVGWETRMALQDQQAMNKALGEPADTLSDSTRRRIDNAAEALVKYLLFADEAPLEAPVKGTSSFMKEFEARGPKDKRGRSLRDYDLTHRMFRYPCSYLIYSAAFDALPGPARERIYRRIWDVVSGKDQTPLYAKLSGADRQGIREILVETKRDLPDYWRQAPAQRQ